MYIVFQRVVAININRFNIIFCFNLLELHQIHTADKTRQNKWSRQNKLYFGQRTTPFIMPLPDRALSIFTQS